MDLDKMFEKVEKIIEKVEQSLDGKDANSVWSTTTRTTRAANEKPKAPVQFKRVDLDFVFDAAMHHPDLLVRRHVKSLREKYLGNA